MESIESGRNSEINQSGSPKYWLSLEQWRKDPEFQKLAEQEFQSNPLSSEDGKDGWARREFLKLMGASMALTTFGCVRRPAQKIVPYVKRPHEVVMGRPNIYASSWSDMGDGFGLLVTTREGRPIKVEGNPDHPLNEGGMSARAHAHILSLYDPNRLSRPQRNLLNQTKTNRDTISVKWDAADQAIVEQLKKGGVAILTPSLTSPSTRTLVSSFANAFRARHFVWEPINGEEVIRAQKLSYGRDQIPRYCFDKAKYIVSIGADFLGTYLAPTAFQKDFAKGRKPGDGMNKLVVFESLMSLTGSNADERFRIKPSQQIAVAVALIEQLLPKTRYSNDGQVKKVIATYREAIDALKIPREKLAKVAEDLWKNRRQGLVIAGGPETKTEQAIALQVAVNFLNSALENEGSTIDGQVSPFHVYKGNSGGIFELVEGLKNKSIKTVIIHGVNPVYALPKSSGFQEALKLAEMAVYTGDRIDETGLFCDYVLPDHHPLENWGDHEFQSGVYAIQQPTIQPLGDTRAFQDSLISWMKLAGLGSAVRGATSWYDYLRAQWRDRQGGANFEGFWVELLQNGVYDRVKERRNGSFSAASFNSGALSQLVEVTPAQNQGYELVLYSTVGLYDGSLANVSWLQEFPDPVTKICWDNYLCVSPATAQHEGLKEGQLVELTVGSEKVEVPVHIQPGQADGVLGLALGYGRKAAGDVANGVGVDAYPLAKFSKAQTVYSGLSASIKKKSGVYPLANVQAHHSMEGRQIIVEATLEQFKKDPGANIHRHKVFSLWSEHEYPGHKWGMAIDLNLCTGCSACVVACQSENNIPTVGKRFVLQGREMHWLRTDRYYVGDPSEPDALVMPVPCMHCDNAPCETVCPVAATVHSEEGTNDMIYNRCVGTRYCSNNCPYKVRRFNWFNYTKELKKPVNMVLNPEVTVRSRGVMEKCTFCIHRIKAAKNNARIEKRDVKDGDVKTACQQSCPTGAIVFGDLNDPNSQVRKLWDQQRQYALLEELNTKPAVRYLSKIRNTEHLKGQSAHHAGGHAQAGQHGSDNEGNH